MRSRATDVLVHIFTDVAGSISAANIFTTVAGF